MDYCPLHEIEYSNSNGECPLCTRTPSTAAFESSGETSQI